MENKEVKPIRLEDGRNAELHTTQNDNEVVTELYAEPPRPLKLESRVVEKKKPVVYERRIQKIGPDGNILEEIVESNEPNVPLQVRDHIGLVGSHSLGVDKYATKEDVASIVVDTVVAAIKQIKEDGVFETQYSSPPSPQPTFVAQSIKDEVAQKLAGVKTVASGLSGLTIMGYGFIALQIAFTVYLLYFN